MRRLRKIGKLLLAAGQGWLKHDAARLAAALAFYTALSLAPLLTMILFIAGQVWGGEAASGFLVSQIETMTDRQAALFIQSVVAQADRPEVGSIAGFISFAILAWGSTRLFAELQASLNVIWEVEAASELRRKLSQFAKKRLLAFGMTLVVAFLLLVSLVLDAGISLYSARIGLSGEAWIWSLVNGGFSMTIVCLLFAFVYKVLPDRRVGWRAAIFGALLASALFSTGKFVLGLYLGSRESVYGAAGSLVAILIWVYFSSQTLFLGAELARSYGEAKIGERPATAPP